MIDRATQTAVRIGTTDQVPRLGPRSPIPPLGGGRALGMLLRGFCGRSVGVFLLVQPLERRLGELSRARTRVVVTITRSGALLLIDIDEDGRGVPAADRERIFEPLRRLDSVQQRGPTGVGLAIVRRIAPHSLPECLWLVRDKRTAVGEFLITEPGPAGMFRTDSVISVRTLPSTEKRRRNPFRRNFSLHGPNHQEIFSRKGRNLRLIGIQAPT